MLHMQITSFAFTPGSARKAPGDAGKFHGTGHHPGAVSFTRHQNSLYRLDFDSARDTLSFASLREPTFGLR
jgi:hypothetical protein